MNLPRVDTNNWALISTIRKETIDQGRESVAWSGLLTDHISDATSGYER